MAVIFEAKIKKAEDLLSEMQDKLSKMGCVYKTELNDIKREYGRQFEDLVSDYSIFIGRAINDKVLQIHSYMTLGELKQLAADYEQNGDDALNKFANEKNTDIKEVKSALARLKHHINDFTNNDSIEVTRFVDKKIANSKEWCDIFLKGASLKLLQKIKPQSQEEKVFVNDGLELLPIYEKYKEIIKSITPLSGHRPVGKNVEYVRKPQGAEYITGIDNLTKILQELQIKINETEKSSISDKQKKLDELNAFYKYYTRLLSNEYALLKKMHGVSCNEFFENVPEVLDKIDEWAEKTKEKYIEDIDNVVVFAYTEMKTQENLLRHLLTKQFDYQLIRILDHNEKQLDWTASKFEKQIDTEKIIKFINELDLDAINKATSKADPKWISKGKEEYCANLREQIAPLYEMGMKAESQRKLYQSVLQKHPLSPLIQFSLNKDESINRDKLVELMENMVEEMKPFIRYSFFNSVCKYTGKLTGSERLEVNNANVGLTLNGVVHGEKCSAEVNTIEAEGPIQERHLRVLVHPFEQKTTDSPKM